MIKIERTPAPDELTSDVVALKTSLFKADHSMAVWKEPYIVRGLIEMSHSKCSYCECKLDEESKYLEVEHFHDKDDYEDEVVIWDNLLPSCKKCNDHKGKHDTYKEPIIDPTKQDPRDHLAFYCYLLRGKTDKGRETESLLHLNDYKHHTLPRFKMCCELSNALDTLYDTALTLGPDTIKGNKTRFRNRMINFLQLCQPDEPYTAVKATVVSNDKKYNEIVDIMKKLQLWSEPLISLDLTMRHYQLDMEMM